MTEKELINQLSESIKRTTNIKKELFSELQVNTKEFSTTIPKLPTSICWWLIRLLTSKDLTGKLCLAPMFLFNWQTKRLFA